MMAASASARRTILRPLRFASSYSTFPGLIADEKMTRSASATFAASWF
jgi:hypothetical protein